MFQGTLPIIIYHTNSGNIENQYLPSGLAHCYTLEEAVYLELKIHIHGM